jgi:ribonuclease HI
VLINGQLRYVGGGAIPPRCTNNIAEATALLCVLRLAHRIGAATGSVRVLSDSQYVVQGFNQWLEGWERNGWTKSDGQPVSNAEIWVALLKVKKRFASVTAHWVRGHDGNYVNEVVDAIARVCNERRTSFLLEVTDHGRSDIEAGLANALRVPKRQRFAEMGQVIDAARSR